MLPDIAFRMKTRRLFHSFNYLSRVKFPSNTVLIINSKPGGAATRENFTQFFLHALSADLLYLPPRFSIAFCVAGSTSKPKLAAKRTALSMRKEVFIKAAVGITIVRIIFFNISAAIT